LTRFEAKYVPEPNSGCWLWTAFAAGRRKHIQARFSFEGDHEAARASWRLHKGPIPAGLQVLHKCDNALCVNPDHLFLGTQLDNIRDMVAKGRARSPRSTANGNGKLTDQEVWEIRQLRGHISQRQLARAYQISAGHVANIQSGRDRKSAAQ
jgi:DNA-binding transcriptional regulator YiaG